jgi:uncharacterized membrane protein YcaP (DUF421 family)
MGKRQLGELQPFDFSITLVAAELACLPMTDPSIPLFYGIIPLLTLFIIHLFITKFSTSSARIRRLVNGKPIVLIAEGTVDAKMLKESNMNINDLLEALRAQSYFNIGEVQYAILETNGAISVMPKFSNKPATTSDLGLSNGSENLPYTIIEEGKFMDVNLDLLGVSDKESVLRKIEEFGLRQKDILLFTLTSEGSVYIQPYYKAPINTELEAKNE